MKQEPHDSRRPYFVTAPLPVPVSLDACSRLLQAAILADMGDTDPEITAMVALPGRVLAVINCHPKKAADPAPRRYLEKNWLAKRCASGTRLRITITEIKSASALRERIDFCHFAPAFLGLVPDPTDWSCSTIHQHAPSEMILT